ncbi:LCP family protein [Lacticaseibacillus suilingensis]|uniref:LCP family protein n=1 Tax=Lacticaseibacillus suilingensis TaxID=2799577 RepID=A0ABW4BH43_9LACO|nr:LCP family protein [Lacticaseibacillus suilingensis]
MSKHRHSKRHPLLRIFSLLVMTIVLLAGSYGVRIFSQTKVAVHKTYDNKVVKKKVVNLAEKKPFSVLLLGTDTGALGRSEKGRTDTMILVTVNPKANRTTMISIPRDTLSHVQSSSYTGATKINAQYTYNDVKGAVDSVTTMFNVPINYYALVNMGGLEKIVDAVGGVNVNVAFSWSDPYSQGSFTKGPAHLNGKQALAYARMRHQDPAGDYGRQKRQQEVISAIVSQALSAQTFNNYGELMNSLADNLRTNLSFDELVTLVNQYRVAFENVTQDHLSEIGAYINTASYQVPSTAELQRVSNLARGELGLSSTTLDNYNTKENALNAQNGFSWNSDNNPRYLLY